MLQVFDQVEYVNRPGKKLLQSDKDSFSSNNLRNEQDAADAIQQTIDNGATLQDSLDAAGMGSKTTLVNSQHDHAVSDIGQHRRQAAAHVCAICVQNMATPGCC